MPHNHPPRCCCELKPNPDAEYVLEALHAAKSQSAGHWPTVAGYLADEIHRLCGADLERCPSCPDHGDLAQAQPQCGECHQLEGRPHTVFCSQASWKAV